MDFYEVGISILTNSNRRVVMLDFARTPMGKKLFEATLPRIAKGLEDLTEELKRANDLKEKELKQKEKD